MILLLQKNICDFTPPAELFSHGRKVSPCMSAERLHIEQSPPSRFIDEMKEGLSGQLVTSTSYTPLPLWETAFGACSAHLNPF